jgi:hypothetical protein
MAQLARRRLAFGHWTNCHSTKPELSFFSFGRGKLVRLNL